MEYENKIVVKAHCLASATIRRNAEQATVRKKVGDTKGIRVLCGGCIFRRNTEQPAQIHFVSGQNKLRPCEDDKAPTV